MNANSNIISITRNAKFFMANKYELKVELSHKSHERLRYMAEKNNCSESQIIEDILCIIDKNAIVHNASRYNV